MNKSKQPDLDDIKFKFNADKMPANRSLPGVAKADLTVRMVNRMPEWQYQTVASYPDWYTDMIPGWQPTYTADQAAGETAVSGDNVTAVTAAPAPSQPKETKPKGGE